MLGQRIHDPHAIESQTEVIEGLDLIPITTHLMPEKILRNVEAELSLLPEQNAVNFKGYEIHCGVSALCDELSELYRPIKHTRKMHEEEHHEERHEKHHEEFEGIVSADGQIFGTYMHGIFDDAQSCAHFLQWAGLEPQFAQASVDLHARREQELDRLMASVEKAMDLNKLDNLLQAFYHKDMVAQC